MRRLRWLAVLCGAASCGPSVRTFEVLVSQEQVCRQFDPQPDYCAQTQSAAVRLTLTIEDRSGGRAVLYGRSDTSADRVYVAQVPRAGRYEVTESEVSRNDQTGCETTTTLVVALDVDDAGLEGGEELRTEESRQCNAARQHRVTRRLREWAGSRDDG
ncbi:MAG: hypothetical protein HY904_26120 [Deltaproteobacteria bacterium]|nr:hypothetical protein [Deltaproteobacteria bacterium]